MHEIPDPEPVREPASGSRAGAVIVDTNEAPRFRRSVALAAQAAQANLLEVSPLDDDLDSVFRYLVGR